MAFRRTNVHLHGGTDATRSSIPLHPPTAPGWNAVDIGPKRDVMAELYEATQKQGIEWGIYYSQERQIK
jgi:hypothetical protein